MHVATTKRWPQRSQSPGDGAVHGCHNVSRLPHAQVPTQQGLIRQERLWRRPALREEDAAALGDRRGARLPEAAGQRLHERALAQP